MTDKIIYDNITYDGSVNEIMSGDVVLGESLAASALSIDTLTVTVASDTAPVYHYAGVVQHYRGNTLMGKYYLKSIKRVGRTQYTLTAVSAIGLLDNITHYGGLYNGTGAIRNVGELFADIVRDTFPYTLDEAMADVFIYGWLPVDTARNNLRQLLFAVGASITKDDDYNPVISPLPSDVKTAIPTTRIFAGGSVDYPTPATAVVVTEHTYIPAEGDASEIYNGEVLDYDIVSPKGEAFAGQIITFNEPHYNYACTGSVILESGANYVVLAPSINAVVTGQSYYHGRKEYRLAAEGSFDAEYVPTCNNCTLVSMANSRNVARRMLAYYSSHMDVTQDVSVIAERPGQRVTFTTPFGDSAEGYIKNMSLRFGQLLRGNVKFDTGYVPTGFGNFYDSFDIVSEDGTYTVPDGVEHIRLVLIGGGSGGSAGENGQNGKTPNSSEVISSRAKRYRAYRYGDSSLYRVPLNYTTRWRKGGRVDPISGEWLFDLNQSGTYYDEFYGTASDAIDRGYNWGATPYGDEYSEVANVVFSGVDLRPYTTEVYYITANSYRKYYDGLVQGGFGGSGGNGGAGGKVYQVDLDVDEGETIVIAIGNGGAGGTDGAGSDGGDTTATVNGTQISSASGESSSGGVINILTGEVLASRGAVGIRGGNGGAYAEEGSPYPGDNVGTHTGGAAGASRSWEGNCTYYGGSGGGASDAANGSDGTQPPPSGSGAAVIHTSGSGGNGANGGTPQNAAVYGSGGNGGGGGGGGGNAGGLVDGRDNQHYAFGDPGLGGTGGAGGNGANGCVIIYYSSVN